MNLMMDLNSTATNLVLRPVEGCVITVNGHRVPQPPWILPDDPDTVIAYDQWLIDQAKQEAQALGDEWMICRLAGADARMMDAATRHLLSDFLFGKSEPEFEAR
jgi:hypothetical protein